MLKVLKVFLKMKSCKSNSFVKNSFEEFSTLSKIKFSDYYLEKNPSVFDILVKDDFIPNDEKIVKIAFNIKNEERILKIINEISNKGNNMIIKYNNINNEIKKVLKENPLLSLKILTNDVNKLNSSFKGYKELFELLELSICDNFLNNTCLRNEKHLLEIKQLFEKLVEILLANRSDSLKFITDFLKRLNKIEFKDNVLLNTIYSVVIDAFKNKYMQLSTQSTLRRRNIFFELDWSDETTNITNMFSVKVDKILLIYKEFIDYVLKERKYFKELPFVNLKHFSILSLIPKINQLQSDTFQLYFSFIDETFSIFLEDPKNNIEEVKKFLSGLLNVYRLNVYIPLFSTYRSISRFGIYERKLFEDQELLFIFLYIFKQILKSSMQNKHSWLSLRSFFFYFNSYLDKNPDIISKIHTHILIHLIYTFGYYSFNINILAINELKKRIPQILDGFVYQRIMLLTTGLALHGHKDEKLFTLIMSNENFLDSKNAKHLINIAFHIAMTKFDHYELWKKFFEKILLLQLNNLDRKMLLDILDLLSLTDSKYDVLHKQYFKTIFDNVNISIIHKNTYKYFQSQNLVGIGLSETIVFEILKKYKIPFKFQENIDYIYNVDFIIFDKIVLNINGVQHYMVEDQFKLNIKSQLKNEILRKKGYYTVDVNYVQTQDEDDNYNNIKKLIVVEMERQLPKDVFNLYNLKKIFQT